MLFFFFFGEEKEERVCLYQRKEAKINWAKTVQNKRSAAGTSTVCPAQFHLNQQAFIESLLKHTVDPACSI